MAVDWIPVVEIMRPADSGETRPFQCRLEDEQMYAVKGKAAFAHGLAAELVAAYLAREIGLPVPDFVIADVPRPLLDFSMIAGVWHGLGSGPAFGSKWQDGAELVSPTIRDRADARTLATIYAFDHWICNGDRTLGDTAGNPNLMYNLADQSLIVFDHNLAFFDTTYSAGDLVFHAGVRAWAAFKSDTNFRNQLVIDFARAFHQFDQIMDCLPEEWLDENPDIPHHMHRTLDRMNTAEFWDDLG
ncbi:hypothetical protein TomMM35A_18220 [Sphingobium sp. TomMM35A]